MTNGIAHISSIRIASPVHTPVRTDAASFAPSARCPLFGHPLKVKLIDPPTHA